MKFNNKKLCFIYSRCPQNLASFRKVLVKIKIIFRIRIGIRIMISLWISIAQNYILYIKDTHESLFGCAKSFKSYCASGRDIQTYRQTARQPDRRTYRQTDGQKDGWADIQTGRQEGMRASI